MKGSKLFTLLLGIVLCVMLLSACGEQATEDPALTQPTTGQTEPGSEAKPTEGMKPMEPPQLDEDELPPVPLF